jgi:hypothetical protein
MWWGLVACGRVWWVGLPIHTFGVFGVFIGLISTMTVTNAFIRCTKRRHETTMNADFYITEAKQFFFRKIKENILFS